MNLIVGSEVALVFLDPELRIKRFTPSVAMLLNLRPSDLDRPFGDFAPRFEDPALLDDCRLVLSQLTPMEREVWAKDESVPAARCFLRRVLPYRAADNRIDGVVITFVDITKRIASEAQARRLATVLRDSNDAVTVQDWEGRILAWNRGAERMYGYPEAEALQMNIRDTMPLENRVASVDYGHLLLREVTGVTIEAQRVTKDGRVLEIELTATPYRDERGELLGVATTERDVTERIHAARQLRESGEQLRAILQTAADAIITIDERGTITAANPATERMFGYTQAELVGSEIGLLMPPPYREEHSEYLARFLRTGEPRLVGIGKEVAGLRKDGSVFPVDLAVSQVNHLGLFTGIIRDISGRRELQKQVLEIAADEQRRIGQELHDGTGQELTGLSLFAGTLVDLLNDLPQQATDDTTNWLIDEAALTRLRQTAHRLSRGLVEANCHVQQLSHGVMPVQIEVEGLRSALQELVTAVDAQQNVSCQLDCPGPVPVADNTNATHLYRIAQEAVSNALRHSGASQIRISLVQAQDRVGLEVSDNGRGFDTLAAKRQVAGEVQRGMGLQIMEYRAGMIGGLLQVESSQAAGTVVRCTVLP
jgi:PAS domain S-box-containing protein